MKDIIVFICHEHKAELTATIGRKGKNYKTIYCRCPFYFYEYRGDNEKACNTRISSADMSDIKDSIDFIKSCNNLYEGYKWETERHICLIHELKGNIIIIAISNKNEKEDRYAGYI